MLFKKKQFYAFAKGKVRRLEDVNDPVFSSGMVGQGIAIEPEDGTVYAPVDGIVQMIFPTKHALGILTKEGYEVIMHIGIDTVKMNGIGFDVLVKENQDVHKGDLLMIADLEKIRESGFETTEMLVIGQPQDIKLKYNQIDACIPKQDVLFSVTKG